jgi:VanZ family protein
MVINPGRSKLAAFVALAYTLVIVYASLQPFIGWRMPPEALFDFLTAVWPRYITAGDITLNVVAYVPFGAMLVIALRPRNAGFFGCLLAITLAALLSLMLESMQMFLPARIASNLDLLANAGGAAIGAMAAWLFGLAPAARRRRLIRTDVLGDCGLIALAAWLFIQFDPSTLALASGDWREWLGLKPRFAYMPATYQTVETCIGALAAVALGLLATQIAVNRTAAAMVAATTIAFTLIAKSAAVWSLARAASPLQWLTPGLSAGLLIGTAVVALLIRLPSTWRSAMAIVCLLATVVLVNITPENPYQTIPPFLRASQQTHLSSFSNIVHLLSQLWPFATSVLLLALARGKHPAPA